MTAATPRFCLYSNGSKGAQQQTRHGDILIDQEDPNESFVYPDINLSIACCKIDRYDSYDSDSDGERIGCLEMPLSYTQTLVDPLLQYSNAVAMLPKKWTLCIEVAVGHPSLTALFGRALNVEWHSVGVRYIGGVADAVRVVFAKLPDYEPTSDELEYDTDDYAQGDVGECSKCISCCRFAKHEWYDWGPDLLDEIEADYAELCRPRVSLLISRVSVSIEPRHSQYRGGYPLATGWHLTPKSRINGRVLVFEGSVEQKHRQLTLLTAFMHPVSFKYVWSPPDMQFDMLSGQRRLKWSPDAWMRRPMHHARLVELAMLFDAFDVPQYVCLWIVDWLPEVARFSHHWKINLLQAVTTSIRLVKERRHLNAKERKQ